MDVALALVCLLYLVLAFDLICGFQKWRESFTPESRPKALTRREESGEVHLPRRTRSTSRTMMLINRSLKGWSTDEPDIKRYELDSQNRTLTRVFEQVIVQATPVVARAESNLRYRNMLRSLSQTLGKNVYSTVWYVSLCTKKVILAGERSRTEKKAVEKETL